MCPSARVVDDTIRYGGAVHVCVVTHIARVRMSRVRLPVLHVVS